MHVDDQKQTKTKIKSSGKDELKWVKRRRISRELEPIKKKSNRHFPTEKCNT